jgi:basic amino acid/polyamine antiporter, APA family
MSTAQSATRQLGLSAAIAIVTGESIALGIFLTPAAMAKSLGSPLLLGLVWLGVAFMAICGAFCYSELAVRYPESGGEFVYLHASYGDTTAFLYGWMSSFVMYPGIAAALAVGSVPYIAQLVPSASRFPVLAPAAILIAFCLLNVIGTRVGGLTMSLLNWLKLAVIAALAVWALFGGHAHLANLLPFTERRPGSDPLLPAIASAVISAFFSFGGWWEAGKIAGEVRNPRRTLPLAFFAGVSIVALLYVGISGAFLAVVPLAQVTSNTAFVAQFGAALFGTSGARTLSACVLICVCGGLAALSMAAPRVIYAMANRGSFFPAFGRLHRKFGTPVNGILLQTVLSVLVLTFGAFDRVLAFIIFSAVLFLAITVSTLFRLTDPVRAWWFPLAPVLFIVSCCVVDALILMHDPIPALVGVGIVLCGIPARRLIRSRATLRTLTVAQD